MLSDILTSLVSQSGGIGRRAGFRILCPLWTWRFEPSLWHKCFYVCYDKGMMEPKDSIFLKHIVVRAFSAFTLIWGLKGLLEQIHEIFVVYGYQNFQQTLTSHGNMLDVVLLQQVFFISLSNFVATAYGLLLISKPTHLIKVAHVVGSVAIILATYYVQHAYSLDI